MFKLLLSAYFSVLCLTVSAGIYSNPAGNQVIIHSNTQHGSHSEHYIPADQPDVWYDADGALLTVQGYAGLAYYDVTITSGTNWSTALTTQVDGTYDTIDISSLTSDFYIILMY